MTVLVISPLHDVADVEEGDAVAVTAGELGYLDLALYSSFLEDEIRECIYFGNISDMSNFSYSKLSSEVTSKGIYFIRIINFILCDED